MYVRFIAIMSPWFSAEGLNMKESLVADEVNFMSGGTLRDGYVKTLKGH